MKYLFQDKNGTMYVPTMKSGAKYCFIDDALPPAPPEPELKPVPDSVATHQMTYETDASGTLLSVSFDSQKIQNYYPTFSVKLNQQSLTITFDRSQIGPFPDYLYLSFYEEGQVYIAERAFNSSGTYDYSFGLVSLSPSKKETIPIYMLDIPPAWYIPEWTTHLLTYEYDINGPEWVSAELVNVNGEKDEWCNVVDILPYAFVIACPQGVSGVTVRYLDGIEKYELFFNSYEDPNLGNVIDMDLPFDDIMTESVNFPSKGIMPIAITPQ